MDHTPAVRYLLGHDAIVNPRGAIGAFAHEFMAGDGLVPESVMTIMELNRELELE